MATLDLQHPEKIKESDWRFAEFVMRTWIDPGLAKLYEQDPCGILAEFGIYISSPADAPELRMGAPIEGILIEELDRPESQAVAYPTRTDGLFQVP